MITYINRVAIRERLNGGVSITRFSVNDMRKYGMPDEDQFIAWYMNRIAPGQLYTLVNESDLPKDRSQREQWKLKNGKVEV